MRENTNERVREYRDEIRCASTFGNDDSWVVAWPSGEVPVSSLFLHTDATEMLVSLTFNVSNSCEAMQTLLSLDSFETGLLHGRCLCRCLQRCGTDAPVARMMVGCERAWLSVHIRHVLGARLTCDTNAD
jgi:hypothetical protein